VEAKLFVGELALLLNPYDEFNVVVEGRAVLRIDWQRAIVKVAGTTTDPLGLRDVLLEAGVILPRNMDEVLGRLEDYSRSPTPEEPRLKAVALDTNIFYNLFLTTLEEERSLPPRVYVSKCVLDEISSKADSKAKPEEREAFVSWRRAAAALSEYLRHRHGLRVIQRSKCHGDLDIVRSYVNYAGSQGVDFLFLTFDVRSRSYALIEALPMITLSTPSPPRAGESFATTHRRIQRLLYTMAVHHASITLTGSAGRVALSLGEYDDILARRLTASTTSNRIASELSLLGRYRKIRETLRLARPG